MLARFNVVSQVVGAYGLLNKDFSFRLFLGVLFSVLWLGQAWATPESEGLAIFEEADRRETGFQDLQVNLTMILRTSRGNESRRALRIKQLEMPTDGDKMLVVFDTPKQIRGTALLSFSHKVDQDDQWLYLPAMKRVKKVTSRNKSGPFLSSEFAFEDLTSPEIQKYAYRYLRKEMLNGVPCFVVERIPKDEFSGYSRQVVWLDENEYRTLKIDYFDRKSSLLKTLTFDAYERYLDRFWRPSRMMMENHQTRKSTELVWSNFRFRTGLDDARDFTTNSLRRVR
ncbi:MAG: outer membrane lipoprotein-sorting protein [Pseudomonadales bacterium]|jgi:hypothetical protein|nr:outer membrane lipoprotein-sorting protein [Pseudomonadales bacterium]MDP6471348.1 outer membrane lipoprotein-sorting protein [Pseudomonadales bacterium]MDP6826461.1 outer membrane lipoprotein-sorting protein [Pseudomonadales bacterium]MDP6970084.1 outer membrane lipoprotein-sorting protein [Pseudomonadales bacterium]|tara:strand:+ start:413 stop:1261 length:849 start_codon:yes stop_codon:yes gene_type:complete